MTGFLEGWGELTDPTPPATTPGASGARAFVDAITSDEDALAVLAAALNAADPDEKLYVFATLPEFLEEFLLAIFHRVLEDSALNWCEQWWRHREARAALTMLWDSWESHRRNPASMLDWLEHRAWPVMDRITGPLSPFDGCKHTVVHPDGRVMQEASHNPRQRRLPVAAAPADLFTPRPTKANPNP